MRKLIALTVVVVLVVAAWTGGWFWLRSFLFDEMDRQLAGLAAEGVEIACPDRSGTGWPFRMEIACARPEVTLPDGRVVTAGAAAATLHVTNPRLVVLSFASPLTIAGGPIAARSEFESLRASVSVDGEKLKRLSVEARGFGLTLTGAETEGQVAALKAGRLEVHLRPSPDTRDSLDLAVSVVGLDGTADGAPILPAPADAVLQASLSAVSLLDGTPEGARAWAAAGGTLAVQNMSLAVGDTRIEGRGTGTVADTGEAAGRLDATATNIAWLTGAAKAGKPLPPALAALGSAFLLLGKPVTGDGQPRALAIAVADGAVTANGLSLGSVPRLF